MQVISLTFSCCIVYFLICIQFLRKLSKHLGHKILWHQLSHQVFELKVNLNPNPTFSRKKSEAEVSEPHPEGKPRPLLPLQVLPSPCLSQAVSAFLSL